MAAGKKRTFHSKDFFLTEWQSGCNIVQVTSGQITNEEKEDPREQWEPISYVGT